MAKELSRIFKGAESEVLPFLITILPVAHDDSSLQNMLQVFGIEEGAEPYSEPTKAELLPTEGEPESEEQREGEEAGEKEGKEEPKVKPPAPPERRKGLINPDEFFPSKKDEFVPHKKTEGQPKHKAKEINIKEGKPGAKEPPKESRPRAGTKDAEGTAIQMVLNYEASEGREAEDRHRQRRIGYDVYSEKPDGEEMFIEVKHFREQAGRFRLTQYELEKAEREGDKYYVYVVTGLKEDVDSKKLYIIQNPLKWLTPDPPIEPEYSDWGNAIKDEITFDNA